MIYYHHTLLQALGGLASLAESCKFRCFCNRHKLARKEVRGSDQCTSKAEDRSGWHNCFRTLQGLGFIQIYRFIAWEAPDAARDS